MLYQQNKNSGFASELGQRREAYFICINRMKQQLHEIQSGTNI